MTTAVTPTPVSQSETDSWHALSPADVSQRLGGDLDRGLTAEEAVARLDRYGPNALQKEVAASVWKVALDQLRDPMNIMLVVVAVVSLLIAEFSTAAIVGLLVALNVVLGTRQELTARASVSALAEMQIPQAKVIRSGTLSAVAATDVVPGDLVAVEAGDIVVADGRIARSANLETQEAALTGESAPIAKGSDSVPADAALGDRIDMLF